jgi:hypothetical protein
MLKIVPKNEEVGLETVPSFESTDHPELNQSDPIPYHPEFSAGFSETAG